MSVQVYHFSSPTCGPCNVIKPAMAELRREFPDVTWNSVNTREDPYGYTGKFKVSVVPTMVVTYTDPSGVVKSTDRHSGTQMIGYHRIIRNALRQLAQ
jgi:hypothetical protein